METSRDWEKLAQGMECLLRLKTFPVAFKLLKSRETLSDIPQLRRMKHKVTLCQLFTVVRTFGWTVGCDLDDIILLMCASIIGLTEVPENIKDGTMRGIFWTKTREDAKKCEEAIPRLPVGQHEAVLMAPLKHNIFDPDIILVYSNPAQMILLINGLQFEDYEVMEFYCVGESSCSDVIARCYLRKKPSLTIPCYGERRYGNAQDDELVMALPAEMMEKAVNGLEALHKKGIRYPISYAGLQLDAAPSFPTPYKKDYVRK